MKSDPMKYPSKPPIIEFAGLPGSGKTAICQAVQAAHFVRGDVNLTDVKFDIRYLALAWNILLLGLSAKPLKLARMNRVIRLIWFGRHYLPHDKRPLLIHQGWVQKMWAILADARSHSAQRLSRVLESIAPFLPDVLIIVNVPVHVAVARIQNRTSGRSRYDKLSDVDASRLLVEVAPLLMKFANLIGGKNDVFVQLLDGQAPLETNRLIVEFLANRGVRPELSAQ
jgi:hypothetical protein